MDKDKGRIALLEEGQVPIYEPGLEELLARGARRGCLRFSMEVSEIVHEADVLFIAVDTPQGHGGSVDLSNVA